MAHPSSSILNRLTDHHSIILRVDAAATQHPSPNALNTHTLLHHKINTMTQHCLHLCAALIIPLCFAVNTSAVAAPPQHSSDEIVKQLPSDAVSTAYYADLQTWDPAVGLIADTHNVMSIACGKDGKIYIPNFVYRKTLKSWLVGTLNATGDTATFSTTQAVAYAPNLKTFYRLHPVNARGEKVERTTFQLVRDAQHKTFVPTDTTLRLGVFLDGGTDMYGMSTCPRFVEKVEIDKQLQPYAFTYRNVVSDTEKEIKIKGYRDGRTLYLKGLDPRYPGAWLQGTFVSEDAVTFVSPQMAQLSSSDDPYVAYAATAEGEDRWMRHTQFSLRYDSKTGALSGFDQKNEQMVNYAIDDEQNFQSLQAYDHFHLTPEVRKAATPSNARFEGCEVKEQEIEFKVSIPLTDTTGAPLDPDFCTYRLWIDGAPYTFSKVFYPKLKHDGDLSEIPYAFYDYNVLQGKTEKKYIYLVRTNTLPKTIGVEVYYTAGGERRASQRLVYNLEKSASSYITSVKQTTLSPSIRTTRYYGLDGTAHNTPQPGLNIVVTRDAQGQLHTEKRVF